MTKPMRDGYGKRRPRRILPSMRCPKCGFAPKQKAHFCPQVISNGEQNAQWPKCEHGLRRDQCGTCSIHLEVK